MKRGDLIRHLKEFGCILRREGAGHSLWVNPKTGEMEAVPRHNEIKNQLAKKICRGLSVPEL
jgi:mRNA interferase HicA